MSITESKFAVGPDAARLEASIATMIAAGYQPAGQIAQLGGQLVQRMDKVDDAQVIASGDSAIAVQSGTVVITKGSAAALSLAAPTAEQGGTRIRITSATAFAHVVTATGLLFDGAEATGDDTATFAAFPGATIDLEAVNQKWNVVNAKAVTVA